MKFLFDASYCRVQQAILTPFAPHFKERLSPVSPDLASGRISEMITAEDRKGWRMKRRISLWATVGFLIASCWVLYTFIAPPDFLLVSMRDPVVQAAAIMSCPIAYAGRYFPLHFWWVPPINAATYALAGLIVEMLRRKLHPSLAI